MYPGHYKEVIIDPQTVITLAKYLLSGNKSTVAVELYHCLINLGIGGGEHRPLGLSWGPGEADTCIRQPTYVNRWE